MYVVKTWKKGDGSSGRSLVPGRLEVEGNIREAAKALSEALDKMGDTSDVLVRVEIALKAPKADKDGPAFQV